MSTKKLTRSTDDKWLGGVAGGLEVYTGIDATLWRIGLVVGTLFTGVFPVVLAYVIGWLVIPQAPRLTVWPTTPAESQPPTP